MPQGSANIEAEVASGYIVSKLRGGAPAVAKIGGDYAVVALAQNLDARIKLAVRFGDQICAVGYCVMSRKNSCSEFSFWRRRVCETAK